MSLPDDPRKIEFVRSLLAKTKQGKVSWTKKGNAFTAAIPDGVTVNFVMGTVAFGTGSWELFTVRDRAGNELIQVKGLDFFSIITNKMTDPLVEATTALFNAVSGGISGDELERAIDSLKKL
jgi:hypothetical protein